MWYVHTFVLRDRQPDESEDVLNIVSQQDADNALFAQDPDARVFYKWLCTESCSIDLTTPITLDWDNDEEWESRTDDLPLPAALALDSGQEPPF